MKMHSWSFEIGFGIIIWETTAAAAAAAAPRIHYASLLVKPFTDISHLKWMHEVPVTHLGHLAHEERVQQLGKYSLTSLRTVDPSMFFSSLH